MTLIKNPRLGTCPAFLANAVIHAFRTVRAKTVYCSTLPEAEGDLGIYLEGSHQVSHVENYRNFLHGFVTAHRPDFQVIPTPKPIPEESSTERNFKGIGQRLDSMLQRIENLEETSRARASGINQINEATANLGESLSLLDASSSSRLDWLEEHHKTYAESVRLLDVIVRETQAGMKCLHETVAALVNDVFKLQYPKKQVEGNKNPFNGFLDVVSEVQAMNIRNDLIQKAVTQLTEQIKHLKANTSAKDAQAETQMELHKLWESLRKITNTTENHKHIINDLQKRMKLPCPKCGIADAKLDQMETDLAHTMCEVAKLIEHIHHIEASLQTQDELAKPTGIFVNGEKVHIDPYHVNWAFRTLQAFSLMACDTPTTDPGYVDQPTVIRATAILSDWAFKLLGKCQ